MSKFGDWLFGREPKVVSSSSLPVSAAQPGMSAGFQLPDERTAMSLSAVNRCVEVLSDSMSKMPAYLMGENKMRLQSPLLRVLNVRPNEAMTPSVRKKMLEASRLLRGNAYDWIIRNDISGEIEELIPIPAELVRPWVDTNGHMWYDVTHPYDGGFMRLSSQDVCHYKAYSHNGLKGISVLERAAQVIKSGTAAQVYGESYYTNGGRPSGSLQTDADLSGVTSYRASDGTVTQISIKDAIRNEWEKVHSGVGNAYRVAILDHGLKYTPYTVSQRDAQFVETAELTVEDVARFFGVPLYKLQAGKQSYSSNEQNAVEYVVGTLHPIVTQYEEEMSYKLLLDSQLNAGQELRLNMMAELRGDYASRGNWYKTMRDIGAYSVNDILELEDLPPVEGGDERLASLNYVPLADWKRLSLERNTRGGDSNESET